MTITHPNMPLRMLERYLDQPMYVRLFVNPEALRGADPIQPLGGGYREHVLQLVDWQLSMNGARAQAWSGELPFVFDGSMRLDILGTFCIEGTTGNIAWVDGFADPYQVRRANDTLLATVTTGLQI